jgi:predicted alpha/beta hydrolase family esterase
MRSDASVARPDAATVRHLLLPGWLDSDLPHWQSHWERVHGCERVQQDDWVWPRRGDWMARLDEVVGELGAASPLVLVAHSLGCQLVAAWAAHSGKTARVLAALLVAPPDLDQPGMPPQLHSFQPIVRTRLPFPALAAWSEDDPFCTPAEACRMAEDWGCAQRSVGARGHVNGDSGLGDWDEGRRWLAQLLSS